MPNERTSYKAIYLIVGLVVCSFFLAGICYIFMYTLENAYKEQAYTTLAGSSTSVAHALSYDVISSQDYLQTTAANFAFALHTTKESNVDAVLAKILQRAQKLDFVGFIALDKKLHIASLSQGALTFDATTQSLLQSGKKSFYAMGYLNDVGKYMLFHTAPVMYDNQPFGILFSGTEHKKFRQLASLQSLHEDVRYSIVDPQGFVLGGTFPALSLGENILDVWGHASSSSAAVLRRIAHSLKVGRNDFEEVTIQGVSYYMTLTPTTSKNWVIVATIPQKDVGERLSYVVYVVVAAALVWFIFCAIMLYLVVRIQLRDRKHAEHYAHRLQWLFDEIPCGVGRFKADEQWTVLDFGRSLLSSLGISAESLRDDYGNHWAKLVHPKDLWNVKQGLHSILSSDQENVILEYRLLLKDKTTLWILETTRVMEDSSGRWFWSIVTNITERKKSELYNQKTSERYKQIFENFEKILYEYDWTKKELRTTQQFYNKFGYPLPENDPDYYIVSIDVIHPDDLSGINDMQYALQTGKKTAEQLIRIKDAQGVWFWCQMRQNAWVDHGDNTVKAIGEIKNVDEETRSLQKLRDDVQRDAFTGLYNKIATAELVERELTLESTQRGVLCIVDVDNFKQVNDNLGHSRGDVVIKDLSSGLSRIFRSDDIVGRIGGDEFLVYIKNMPKLGALLVKLDNVLKFFRQTLTDDGVEVNISCSIGIALFPKDGSSYQDLYANADKALYRSKKRKGIYTFYDAKIDV